jgi:hypothetical protein
MGVRVIRLDEGEPVQHRSDGCSYHLGRLPHWTPFGCSRRDHSARIPTANTQHVHHGHEDVIRRHVSLTEQIERTLAAISTINLELVAHRHMD